MALIIFEKTLSSSRLDSEGILIWCRLLSSLFESLVKRFVLVFISCEELLQSVFLNESFRLLKEQD
jgi:hypothetical protein